MSAAPQPSRMLTLLLTTLAMIAASAVVAGADEPDGETWRGLVVAAEDRCSVYVRDDYGPAAAEEEIAKNWGGGGRPTTGPSFPTGRVTESISSPWLRPTTPGCAPPTLRRAAASGRDLDNLTLATDTLNRHKKVAKDAAEWSRITIGAGSPAACWR